MGGSITLIDLAGDSGILRLHDAQWLSKIANGLSCSGWHTDGDISFVGLFFDIGDIGLQKISQTKGIVSQTVYWACFLELGISFACFFVLGT